MSTRSLQRLRLLIPVALFLLLLAKYYATYVMYPGVPFGYDAGIYRFLFIREGAGLPPFLTPELPEWARGHAPGLFFFTSLLTHLGVSADLLIGFLWNLVPVALALLLAILVYKEEGEITGVFVLLSALLSVGQFAGFEMMYYKVFVSLGFCSLAFHAYGKRSWTWVPLGMFTIATHQQIGFVYVLSVLCALASEYLFGVSGTGKRFALFLLSSALGAAWYIPTYERSVADVLPRVFASGTVVVAAVGVMGIGVFGALIATLPRKDHRVVWILAAALVGMLLLTLPYVSDAPALLSTYLFSRVDTVPGAFLSINEYLLRSGPLLLLGLTGLVLSAEKERGTPWQWAALLCGVASVGMFFFYRRFLLPLDFFLLPFAARACALLWSRGIVGRLALTAVLLMQSVLTFREIRTADPHVTPAMLTEIASLADIVEPHGEVIVLDNMAPWVLGYLPDARVSGPGIFDSRPYEEWESFLLGSEAERADFISGYPSGTYFYASDVFDMFYPDNVKSLLRHRCLAPTSVSGLFRSVCSAGAPSA